MLCPYTPPALGLTSTSNICYKIISGESFGLGFLKVFKTRRTGRWSIRSCRSTPYGICIPVPNTLSWLQQSSRWRQMSWIRSTVYTLSSPWSQTTTHDSSTHSYRHIAIWITIANYLLCYLCSPPVATSSYFHFASFVLFRFVFNSDEAFSMRCFLHCILPFTEHSSSPLCTPLSALLNGVCSWPWSRVHTTHSHACGTLRHHHHHVVNTLGIIWNSIICRHITMLMMAHQAHHITAYYHLEVEEHINMGEDRALPSLMPSSQPVPVYKNHQDSCYACHVLPWGRTQHRLHSTGPAWDNRSWHGPASKTGRDSRDGTRDNASHSAPWCTIRAKARARPPMKSLFVETEFCRIRKFRIHSCDGNVWEWRGNWIRWSLDVPHAKVPWTCWALRSFPRCKAWHLLAMSMMMACWLPGSSSSRSSRSSRSSSSGGRRRMWVINVHNKYGFSTLVHGFTLFEM